MQRVRARAGKITRRRGLPDRSGAGRATQQSKARRTGEKRQSKAERSGAERTRSAVQCESLFAAGVRAWRGVAWRGVAWSGVEWRGVVSGVVRVQWMARAWRRTRVAAPRRSAAALYWWVAKRCAAAFSSICATPNQYRRRASRPANCNARRRSRPSRRRAASL